MSCLNFAMQQNYIPLIKSITVLNSGTETLTDINVRVSFEPGFAREYTSCIEKLEPGRPVELSPVNILVSPDYMFSLSESMAAIARIELYSIENGIEHQLWYSDSPVDLMPFDFWTGGNILPEMTAAFVTPNHPAVAKTVAKAAAYLAKWTGDPAFTGYTTCNPNIVKKQAAAIYAALQAENIAYMMPPPSYFAAGQRVRLADTVLNTKQGTCIDLALLYAACLEAIGLSPLIVLTEGHAFGGFWLGQQTFPECINDDPAALTKRAAKGIDELCLIECTAYTAGKDSTDFEGAERLAMKNLEDTESFRFTVDISRCRASGIRPIPLKIEDAAEFTADYGKKAENTITSAPSEIDMTLHGAAAGERELTKQAVWERKLLDLSLRNSLLNFRPGAMSVQLMTDDLSRLEDEISRGESFRIMPVPQEQSFMVSDSRIFELENNRDKISAIAGSEFKNNRLRSFSNESELEQKLKKLHRSAKQSLEENGANTLFLALGFLKWYETDRSEKPRYAPLVLIPVDLVRNLREKAYSVRIRDEDAQMNVTLLELLRQDHGITVNGLDPLPQDESGTDLALVFNTIRQSVMARPRWDVEESAFIGQFSFSQFIMWNDLKNRSADLEKNKIVKSLMEGSLQWTPETEQLSPQELDETVKPSDMAIPTSADSSQLAAIYAAAQSESFVLHGPPGTGKSQTITNLIANALFSGKSVLFVAEKMAALSVVQKRLAKIGLDPFCLELHSNKAQKRAVLGQLEQTLNVGRIKPASEYERTAEELHLMRQKLNNDTARLHEAQPAGFSLYDAIMMYDRTKQYKGTMDIRPEFTEKCTPELYSEMCGAVSQAAAAENAASAVSGRLSESPLREYIRTDYSPEIRDSFEKLCRTAVTVSMTMQEKRSALFTAAGISAVPTKAKSDMTAEALKAAVTSQLIPEAAASPELEKRRTELDALIEDTRRYAEARTAADAKYESTVYSLDASQLKLDWKKNEQKWFLPKALGAGKIVKNLAVHAKDPSTVTKENYAAEVESLCALSEMKDKIGSADPSLTALLGSRWKGADTDTASLKKALDDSADFRRKAIDSGCSGELFHAVSDLDDITKNKLIPLINEDTAQARELSDCLGSLEKYADLSAAYNADNWTEAVKNSAEKWLGGIDGIRERTVLEGSLQKLTQLGLPEVSDALRNGDLTADNISSAFECEFSRAAISLAFRKTPSLGQFSEAQFDEEVSRYRDTLKKFEQLTVQELCAKLSANIPNVSAGKGSSELAILQKAIRSGGRMLSIRKLFDQIPTLLRRICPCMLMSPISVAQYIDPSFPKFDLVVFDEASQLPTAEAVGAIARGENVIVVGDPKQLPPTSFFTANQTDDENYDKEDLESVLDDCLALTMPSKHLLWHYRSRHESLIAFSNARFYENKLMTFPSPDDLDSKVKWVNVEGVYDKGKTKQNRAEGEAVVAEICRRLRDPVLRHESIGVVTFSIVQQNLIDDLLSDAFINEPELETAANEMYEPIIIKNLENVQGDERDHILFSVGYGPDKDGKVSMNFGPLNRDGGWRRLNVAVSRARKSMTVYSTLRPEQIDLSRTRSDGVEQLRAFLEFAAKGNQALAVNSAEKAVEPDNFAVSLAEALRKEGYEVKVNVGCSGYRIDAAIVNPDEPSRYLLGIICDGSRHSSNATARDRNIVQPSVLEGLGWRLHNVHALDWLSAPEKVVESVKSAAENALFLYREPPEPSKEETPAPAAVSPDELEREEAPSELSERCEKYVPWNVRKLGEQKEYYLPEAVGKTAEEIKWLLEAEAPVSVSSVKKRILAAWGLSRGGSKADGVFLEAVAKSGGIIREYDSGAEFIWAAWQLPDAYDDCRVPDENSPKRPLDEIAPEEIASAAALIISELAATTPDDLAHEIAKLFGWSRIGESAKTAVDEGIGRAQELGKIVISDGKVTLP